MSTNLGAIHTKLVSDNALEAYRGPNGSYHHARFALMMSMAGRARRFNLLPSADDLRSLFNQIDLEDGGFYQTPEHQAAILAETNKALNNT